MPRPRELSRVEVLSKVQGGNGEIRDHHERLGVGFKIGIELEKGLRRKASIKLVRQA